ncbi:MAG: hypothetical protein H6707_05725 [Deltaproteobacteria bacterium]|nr:hypothetical protein [Deltaproteobacteria bacterium]
MRERIGDILVKAGKLDPRDLQRALAEQQRWGGQLGRYLVEMGFVSEETLIRALSRQYRLPAVALDPKMINPQIAQLVPRDLCQRFQLLCFAADHSKRFLDLAMADPGNIDAVDQVRMATRCNVRPHIAAPTAIEKAIAYIFYGELPGTQDLDLSPDSPLRQDPHAEALVAEAQQEAARVPGGPDLQVKVRARQPAQLDPVRIAERVRIDSVDLALAAVPSGEGFHITLDVPPIDKARLVSATIEERLAQLEAISARNTRVLEGLLKALVEGGLLRPEVARRLSKS